MIREAVCRDASVRRTVFYLAIAIALSLPLEASGLKISCSKCERAVKTVTRPVGKVAGNVVRAVEEAVGGGAAVAVDAHEAAARAVVDVHQLVVEPTAEFATQTATAVMEPTIHITESTVKIVGKSLDSTAEEISEAGADVGKNLDEAAKDVGAEAKRAVVNVGELGEAVGKYVERSVSDTRDVYKKTANLLREGRVVDAFMYNSVQPWKDTEGRASKLAQESSLANTVGAVAASAYGGPGGAAAYSAWYAYNASGGNLEIALKAGVISGLTSAGFSAANSMPIGDINPAYDVAKKAAVTGAIGGVAVAASGGDDKAILEGFLRSGGMVLIQDGYKQYTGGQNLEENLKGAELEAFCTQVNPQVASACAPPSDWFKKNPDGSYVMENGHGVLDMSKVDPRHSFVGLAQDGPPAGMLDILVGENGKVMNTVAKIPGMNAMAIFHDEWVITSHMEGMAVQGTIIPAIVLTYLGTEAGVQGLIQDSILSTQGQAQASAQFAETARAELTGSTMPTQSTLELTGSRAEDPLVHAKELPSLGASSYLCMKGPGVTEPEGALGSVVSRTIFLAKGQPPSELACVVIYQKTQEAASDEAPWYAVQDQGYCEPKAKELADKHVKSGWSCLAR